MSQEDYLAWEETQADKHEYVGGVIFTMEGGTLEHATIVSNVHGVLHAQLRGKRCRAFTSALKIRIEYPTHTRFYYPDATAVCTAGIPKSVFHSEPVVIVEVSSESTHRINSVEKRDAYQSIATMRVYIQLDQDKAEAIVWRRGDDGFAGERITGLDAVIELPEIEARLPLAEAYEGVSVA